MYIICTNLFIFSIRGPPNVRHFRYFYFLDVASATPVAVRDVITEIPCIPPAGGAFIISFGRSPSRRPRFVHFHCLFRTEYKLICSFNTFCTGICPYYVQKTYKTTYEFHFQLAFSRRVRSVTSHGVPSHPAGWGNIHYIFRAFSESETPICTLFTVFSVQNTN